MIKIKGFFWKPIFRKYARGFHGSKKFILPNISSSAFHPFKFQGEDSSYLEIGGTNIEGEKTNIDK